MFLLLLYLIGQSDAYTLKIPNHFILGLLLWWFLFPGVSVQRTLSAAGITVLVFFSSFLFHLITKRKGLGSGDVKLIFVLTLYLGFTKGLYLIFFSCIFFIIYRIIIFAVNRKDSGKAEFSPFGPSIVCAAVFLHLFL